MSDVDAAGARAFETLKKSARLIEKRSKKRRRRWKVVRLEIDGRRLERWFLKTLINLGVSNSTSGTWSISGKALADPPIEFVEAAFGRRELESPLGLYAVATVGEDIIPLDGMEARTLIGPKGLVGAMFTFLGYRFLLLLESGDVPLTASLPAGERWIESALMHRIARFNNKVGKKLSHYVQFLWHLD